MTAVPVEQRSGPYWQVAVHWTEDVAAVGAGNLLPLGDQASPVSTWEAPADGQVVAMIINSEATADVDMLVQVAGSAIAASALSAAGVEAYKFYNDGDVPFSKDDSIAVESDAVTTAKDLHVTLLIELDLRTR